jgi:aerotaxis receptor
VDDTKKDVIEGFNMSTTPLEMKMNEHDFIVSKTDPKGHITYCNDAFMIFSGFYEEELIGKNHNIIRHSDMPRSVFRAMWQALQKKEEFFGFIKNGRKDGGFYWTFANVTPSFSPQGELLGYYSVRRYPKPDAVSFFSDLYKQMCDIEAEIESSQKAMDASYKLLLDAVNQKGGYNEFICSYYR